jgi:anti-sigma B factor antagonist
VSGSDESSEESYHLLRDALRPAGPPRVGFSARHAPGEVVVQVEGELDVLTAPRLAAELNTVIRTTPGGLVLDLRRVEFIDSAGLQLLLNVRRRLDRVSRTLAVVCDEGPVRRVIDLARLTETLGVVTASERCRGRSRG